MTSYQQPAARKGRPLPKFGEWDVNNPGTSEGFTVIFAKARDEKRAKAAGPPPPSPPPPPAAVHVLPPPKFDSSQKKSWCCCF